MARDTFFVANCLPAAVGHLLLASLLRLPIGYGPGMGLLLFCVRGSCAWVHMASLDAVFLSGFILILTLMGPRWLLKLRQIP